MDLQECRLVLAPVHLLRLLYQPLGHVQGFSAVQQLRVQGLQLQLLVVLKLGCPLLVALGQDLQHVVVVLLQVLLLPAKVLLQRYGSSSPPSTRVP